MRTFEVGGRTAAVHVEEPVGPTDAPDLVLVHGAGFDHNVFRFQTRYFAGRGHRVFAPDLPGHGVSDGPASSTIPEMADWLDGALEELDVRDPVVLGHSMGSFIALAHTARHPEKVSRLVLVATTDRMRVHPELLSSAQAGDQHAIDLMVGWMHSGNHRFGGHRSAGSWSAGLSRRIIERNLDVLGTDLAACNAYDPAEAAAEIRTKTMILVGSDDRMTTANGGFRLCGLIEGCRTAVVPGGGHAALYEQSRVVNSAIREFIAASDAGLPM